MLTFFAVSKSVLYRSPTTEDSSKTPQYGEIELTKFSHFCRLPRRTKRNPRSLAIANRRRGNANTRANRHARARADARTRTRTHLRASSELRTRGVNANSRAHPDLRRVIIARRCSFQHTQRDSTITVRSRQQQRQPYAHGNRHQSFQFRPAIVNDVTGRGIISQLQL